MKMSTRGQYALEIAVDLALHLMPDRLESLNDIAKRRNLSEKYLERIMKLLKEAGLVKSVRGACLFFTYPSPRGGVPSRIPPFSLKKKKKD